MTLTVGDRTEVEREEVVEAGVLPAPQTATLPARALAVLVDLLLYLGVAWVLSAVLATVVCSVSRPAGSAEGYALRLSFAHFCLWALVPVIYLLVAVTQEVFVLGQHGATIGKSRAGLRVESSTSEPLSTRRLFLRLLLGPKGPIAPVAVVYYLICGVHLHDSVAGTRVISTEREAIVVTGKLAYLPGVVSAMAAAMILMGLPLLFRFEALFADLGAPPTAIAVAAAETRRGAVLWAPAGVLAIALVWLPPRSRLDVVTSWWLSLALLGLAIVGLMALASVGLLSILSLVDEVS